MASGEADELGGALSRKKLQIEVDDSGPKLCPGRMGDRASRAPSPAWLASEEGQSFAQAINAQARLHQPSSRCERIRFAFAQTTQVIPLGARRTWPAFFSHCAGQRAAGSLLAALQNYSVRNAPGRLFRHTHKQGAGQFAVCPNEGCIVGVIVFAIKVAGPV